MLERLRQIAFMVQDLDEATDLYRRLLLRRPEPLRSQERGPASRPRHLGMESCFSEDLSRYGLKNAVLPAGDTWFGGPQFLE